MSNTESRQKIELLQSQVAALEQLLEIHERTTIEQTERLEQAMAALQIAKQQSEERAEEQVRRLVEFQSAILNNAGYAIITTTTEGILTALNPAAERMLGYTAEECVKLSAAALHDPEEVTKRARLFSAELGVTIEPGFEVFVAKARRNLPNEYEWTYIRKDGSRFPVLLSITALRDSQGTIFGFLGIANDITERKLAEEALRESEAKFKALADNLAVGLFIHQEGVVRYIGREGVQMLGYDNAGQIVGRSIMDFVHETERARVADLARRRIAGEPVPSRYETRFARQDGTSIDVLLSNMVVEYEGHPATQGTFTDITDYRRLETQIQESLERRSAQVQASTQIAQEIAAAPALDELFRRVVTLIKERLGYYHVQIFRHAPAADAVVLVAGYGEAGRKMLALGHTLAMGHGVVGTAADTGKSVLATDVTQDKDWRPNPNLPGTQGELAVPIKLRDQVLGILDVQSDRAGALTAEDQLLLEGLCGQIASAIESTRLLAEHARAEQVLRASEAQLAEAMRTARLANWEYDVAKDTFTFNDQFYALLRTTAEREGGYTMSSAQYAQRFVHPDDAPRINEEVTKAIHATDPNYSYQLDHRVYYADGELGYMTVRFRTQQDAEGRTIKTLGANQDTTERKLAEVALKETEERFRVISETVPIPILISSLADGTVLYGNESLGQTFGLPIQDLIGRQTPDFYFDPADRRLLMERLKREGMLRDYELHVKKFDGTPFWVLVSMRRLTFAAQPALLAAFYDVTERKQTEAKMQQALNEIERLYRATTREGWEVWLKSGQLATGYTYDRDTVQADDSVWSPQIEQALQQNALISPSDQNAVAVAPLSVRGAVVGALGVQDDPQRPLSPDELALLQEITEQGALALENARLYQDAQRRAVREQLVGKVTTHMRETLDVDTVIRTALDEIYRAMGLDEVTIHLALHSAEAATAPSGNGSG